jgi:protein MPE1
MSSVFYRWGARRDESRVTFDGTHISVFDLKREIVLGNKMGNGKDFDLGIFDNVTGEGESVSIQSLLMCPSMKRYTARRHRRIRIRGRGEC